MVKNLFKIIIILLFLAFLIAGARQFLLNKKTASAQHPFFGGLVCDEPIPIGEVLEDAQVLLDDVYKKYRALHQAVSLEVQSGQNWQAELYKTEEVCDFSKCQSLCANSSPDLIVKGTALGVGVTPAYEFCSPICVEKQCLGEPCPDAQEYLDLFGVADELIQQSYADIEVLFAANKVIPNDVKKEDDKPGAQISQIEVLRRKLELAGEWLSPYSGIGKRTCALSSTERARVEAGEIGDRFSMKCVEALENGVYWPKAWSEKCESQCKEEKLSDDCRNCLSQDPGNEGSALAKINYKIYGVCQDSCKQGLTEECNDCLCKGLSEDECTAWVCGGSYNNWACCHETLLEEREPVPVTPVEPSLPSCAEPSSLAVSYGVPYPAKRSPELEDLLACIETQTAVALPPEAGSNSFYGSVFTYDHTHEVCNYSRGETICESCSHSVHSCHYGGTNGKDGALAVDFGNENNFADFKNAAMTCGVPSDKILLEGDHIHISHPSCQK